MSSSCEHFIAHIMATHPEFCEMTTNDEAARAFSKEIYQKTFLVTGVGPKGLGEALAISIASQRPALLILASRTMQKLEAVSAVIINRYPDVTVSILVVDFSSQKSVRSAAKEVSKITTKIHTIINNAGVVVPELLHTEDGIEMQFGTNHIGSWLFTNLLLDQLRQATKGAIPGSVRVVNVSSGGHRVSPIRFSDYNFEGHELPDSEKPPPNLPPMFASKDGEAYSGFISYGQSKTANILTSVYLTQHLQRQGIVSYAVHPGCRFSLARNERSLTWLSSDLDRTQPPP